MDQDMGVAEIRFSQNLCSCMPKTRNRALKRLHEYIRTRSQQKEFTPESFDKLARGLHYAMWMQDKMILQEELSDEYGSLLKVFKTQKEVNEFMRSMLCTLSRHWTNIDRWRVDKFLQLVRRLFRAYFVRLHDAKWDEQHIEDAIFFLRTTVITPEDSDICEALKLHFASIYIEELDYAGDLSKESVIRFLQPYALLLEKKLSTPFFGSVCTEVFGTILEGFAAELEAEQGNAKIKGEVQGVGKPIEFDYREIAKLLQVAAESELTSSKRKKRIAAMIKQFEAAAENRNPFAQIEKPDRNEPITNDIISRAVDQIYSFESKVKRERKQFKKVKKQLAKSK